MGLGERINGLFKKGMMKLMQILWNLKITGYVFISHSHKDIKKVRKIRNMIENSGFEPLYFFLKCLTDDVVEGLIKREIDARDWFVYVDGIDVEGEITGEVLDDVTEQIEVIARNIIQSELDKLV